ncbi:MAG: hypothetical protein IT558_06525 [Alphaproteobacteria bacterium]|nr:hypothetical protein [Alphaproteobacteria bacterium]
MSRIRWSDNDKYFGIFTLSKNGKSYNPIALTLDSGCNEYPRCKVRISIFGWTLISPFPRIIKPWKRWIDTSHYEWSKGSSGYWDVHRREYGFSYSDGFLQVFLGPQTHDSTTTKSWNKFLPWTQWRHVRTSHYGLYGEHFYTENKKLSWEKTRELSEACPYKTFSFVDYDGEEIQAKTTIQEREWHFGTGWFKWLSVFRKPKIARSLNINFSAEVGPEKGSWKGGTVGHGIDMLPGELHEDAFRRYCEQEHRARGRKYKIKFIGSV